MKLEIDFNRTRFLFPNELNSLSQGNSALIHIRGGDFLEHRLSIGILGKMYYEKVFNLLEEKGVTGIHVMTDDVEFAQKVLPIAAFATISYIQKNENIANFEYLSLFAFPSHIIISNSTFSWWGAQCAKTGSNVIAPETWNRSEVRRSLLNLNQWEAHPSIWY